MFLLKEGIKNGEALLWMERKLYPFCGKGIFGKEFHMYSEVATIKMNLIK